jgi:hypothetical protein
MNLQSRLSSGISSSSQATKFSTIWKKNVVGKHHHEALQCRWSGLYLMVAGLQDIGK